MKNNRFRLSQMLFRSFSDYKSLLEFLREKRSKIWYEYGNNKEYKKIDHRIQFLKKILNDFMEIYFEVHDIGHRKHDRR